MGRTIRKNALLIPLIASVVMIGGFSIAFAEEDPVCDAKGPCCKLDWTGQGATIVKIVGEGLVSQSPWVPATVGMRVENGGRVMALDKSTLIVAFDDGCWYELKENEMITIEDVSPCCAAHIPPPAVVPPEAVGSGWGVPAAIAAGAAICAFADCLTEEKRDISP